MDDGALANADPEFFIMEFHILINEATKVV